jgi:uncharacterized membrane protein
MRDHIVMSASLQRDWRPADLRRRRRRSVGWRVTGNDLWVPSITREVEIDARPDAVWSLLESVRRLPEFSSSTVEVTDAPERITEVGQTFTQVGKLLGKRYRSTWTVTALEPGRRLESEGAIARGVTYSLSQRLEPVGSDRTRLTLVITYSLPGGALGRLASKAGVESRAAREGQAVLDGIKSVVEKG